MDNARRLRQLQQHLQNQDDEERKEENINNEGRQQQQQQQKEEEQENDQQLEKQQQQQQQQLQQQTFYDEEEKENFDDDDYYDWYGSDNFGYENENDYDLYENDGRGGEEEEEGEEYYFTDESLEDEREEEQEKLTELLLKQLIHVNRNKKKINDDKKNSFVHSLERFLNTNLRNKANSLTVKHVHNFVRLSDAIINKKIEMNVNHSDMEMLRKVADTKTDEEDRKIILGSDFRLHAVYSRALRIIKKEKNQMKKN